MIVVCVKAVKANLVHAGDIGEMPFVVNPHDLKALQDCIALKKTSGQELVCVCMGPSDAENMLVRIRAMGADQTILLNDKEFAGSDTVATSYILANAIQKLRPVDLVAFGEKSIDGETGQVVFGVAEHLNQTCITGVESIVEITPEYAVIQKNSEDFVLTMKIALPQSLAYSGSSTAYPLVSMPALKRAKSQGITIWNAQDIGADVRRCGLEGSKTKVVGIQNQLHKKHVPVLRGSVEEKVDAILAALA